MSKWTSTDRYIDENGKHCADCDTAEQAARIVALLNEGEALERKVREWREALEEIKLASRGVPESFGCDRFGDCTLADCRCSNHVARAALRAAIDAAIEELAEKEHPNGK